MFVNDLFKKKKLNESLRDGDTNFGSTVTHGSWVVYDGSKVKRFKSREGAKAYAEKNGGKVASSEFYADNIQGKQGVAEGSDSYLDSKPYNPPRDAEGRSYLDSKPYNPPRDAQGKSYLDPAPYNPPRDAQGKSYLDFDPIKSQMDSKGKSYFDTGVEEGSAQDRLHRRHQELRKKSGLPDPDYYKELKASYDIEDDTKRIAAQAEIKKKYRVAEGLPQTLRKVVPGYAKREIDKKMDAGKFGKTDADKDANFQRYKKIQDKLKEQGVAEAGPFSYGAKKPKKGSMADLAARKRKEQERGKPPIEPMDQMVGTARVIKDVSEDFDDMSPHTSYVQSKRTVTSVNGKDHLSDRTASLSTDKSGNQRVRAVDGDKLTIDTNIPKGVNVKMIPQITNEDVEQYLEEMRRAGYDIVTEAATLCPECGGTAYADQMLAEKQDACYSKVKSRYKVWPSAYASGALVRCRKVGAKNWGNKSKK